MNTEQNEEPATPKRALDATDLAGEIIEGRVSFYPGSIVEVNEDTYSVTSGGGGGGEVTGTGGGGFVQTGFGNQVSGYSDPIRLKSNISPVEISSETIREANAWIRWDSGGEENRKFPQGFVRKGHSIWWASFEIKEAKIRDFLKTKNVIASLEVASFNEFISKLCGYNGAFLNEETSRVHLYSTTTDYAFEQVEYDYNKRLNKKKAFVDKLEDARATEIGCGTILIIVSLSISAFIFASALEVFGFNHFMKSVIVGNVALVSFFWWLSRSRKKSLVKAHAQLKDLEVMQNELYDKDGLVNIAEEINFAMKHDIASAFHSIPKNKDR
jgi:hypothetical protein